ncbi:MAG: hypothetical protein IJW32_05175 [Clostridia bacterium]|nr:hypothetical protein [Clostridia bacterium]
MEANTNVKTSKKKKVVAIVLVSILVIAALSGVLYWIFGDHRTLNFDFEKGGVAGTRVETAQYTPDIDKYLEVNGGGSTLSSNIDAGYIEENIATAAVLSEPSVTQEEFQTIIDEFAKVDNYAGAGKYQGYDIYEIKEELKFVVEKVPAFNQWFRMPTMRENQGYVSIPYYEGWAYYLELELEPLKLSVTRVCWCTRSSFMDFKNKTFVEDYADGSSVRQFEVMKTNYFTDENGDEVVEAYIYSVGVDHTRSRNNYYNDNTSDYKPYEYQYLKNVKDKTLVTYHITAATRMSMYNNEEYFEGWTEDSVAGDDGMDVRGLTPYGARREFRVVNYDGYSQIDMLDIDQQFATMINPTATGEVSFDMDSNNIDILANTIGLKLEDYENAADCNELLDIISKHIVDNFELKLDWADIYRDSSNAIEVDLIEGPHYGKTVPISYMNLFLSCRGHYQEEIEFDVDADVYDLSFFNLSKQYSLSMALRERSTGKVTIVATSYDYLEDRGDYYSLPSTYLDLVADDVLRIKETGVYDITCVLTVKENGQDVILFDTLETAFLRSYYGLKISDLTDTATGITYKYAVKGVGGKIVITVTSDEVVE